MTHTAAHTLSAAELDKLEAAARAVDDLPETIQPFVSMGGQVVIHTFSMNSEQVRSVAELYDAFPPSIIVRLLAQARAALTGQATAPAQAAPSEQDEPYGWVFGNSFWERGNPRATEPVDVAVLVNRFLAWPLPGSVAASVCPGVEQPIGTHLMDASEARSMLEHILAGVPVDGLLGIKYGMMKTAYETEIAILREKVSRVATSAAVLTPERIDQIWEGVPAQGSVSEIRNSFARAIERAVLAARSGEFGAQGEPTGATGAAGGEIVTEGPEGWRQGLNNPDRLYAASQAAPGVGAELPRANDGKEQDEFEAWATGDKYDMTTHPLHWLFLNERTYAARQGWKAALQYVNRSVLTQPENAEARQDRFADVVDSLRDYAGDPGYSHNDYADTMLEAANCIELLRARFWNHDHLATPAQPAGAAPADEGPYGDAYQGAREDLAIWKKRALEAEAKLRAAPHAPVVRADVPAQFPLKDGAFVRQEARDNGEHGWLLYSHDGKLIRGLNAHEREFIDCALAASPSPSAPQGQEAAPEPDAYTFGNSFYLKGNPRIDDTIREFGKRFYAAPVAGEAPAEDAARFQWLEQNRTWRTRYRIKPGRPLEWQMLDDGEPWGQWGDLRKVVDAARKVVSGHDSANGGERSDNAN